MNRLEKEHEVEILAETAGQAPSAFLLDFKGLNVALATELRRQLRDNDATLRVVKNRLALLALADVPLGNLNEQFAGQTAIAYLSRSDADVVTIARLIRDFTREHEVPQVKAGVVDGESISVDEFIELAGLPSSDELVAKALYLMQYPVTGFVTALHGVVRGAIVVLDQIRNKKEDSGEA